MYLQSLLKRNKNIDRYTLLKKLDNTFDTLKIVQFSIIKFDEKLRKKIKKHFKVRNLYFDCFWLFFKKILVFIVLYLNKDYILNKKNPIFDRNRS